MEPGEESVELPESDEDEDLRPAGNQSDGIWSHVILAELCVRSVSLIFDLQIETMFAFYSPRQYRV